MAGLDNKRPVPRRIPSSSARCLPVIGFARSPAGGLVSKRMCLFGRASDGLDGGSSALTSLKMRRAVPMVPGVFPGVRPANGRFTAGVRAGVFETLGGGSMPLSCAISVLAACKATSRDSMRDRAVEYLLLVACEDLFASSTSCMSAVTLASISCARSSARLRAALAESKRASDFACASPSAVALSFAASFHSNFAISASLSSSSSCSLRI